MTTPNNANNRPSPRPDPRIGRRLTMSGVFKLVAFGLVIAAVPLVRWMVPVSVEQHAVTRGPVVVEVFARGTVESRREAQVGFDLAGRVVAALVDEGDRVTIGQELARLDPEAYEAELRTASSGVDAARAALHRLAAEERHARTTLELADREERRIEPLVATGVAPSQELDLARDQRHLARDALDRVQAQITEATRGIEVARGSAEQSRVTAVRATLLAPFDGYVARRFRDPGDTVAIGASVLRLVDTELAQVEAWVDETALPVLVEGQPATVTFPGIGASFPGRLRRIAKEADRKTHEVQVDVELSEWPPRFVVGQRADVWLEVRRHPDAVRVANAFIRRDDSGAPFVYLDRDGRIARQTVELGAVGRDVVALTAGAIDGDVVLAAPLPGQTLPLGRRWEAPE